MYDIECKSDFTTTNIHIPCVSLKRSTLKEPFSRNQLYHSDLQQNKTTKQKNLNNGKEEYICSPENQGNLTTGEESKNSFCLKFSLCFKMYISKVGVLATGGFTEKVFSP